MHNKEKFLQAFAEHIAIPSATDAKNGVRTLEEMAPWLYE